MLGRQRTELDPINGSVATPRFSIADAVWSAKERVAWAAGNALAAIGEALRWPFERVAWGFERVLVWPLQERASGWGATMRVAVAGGALLLAAAALAGGVLVARNAGDSEVTAPASLRVVSLTGKPSRPALPFEKEAPATPLLKGATPDFSHEAQSEAAKATGAIAGSAVVSKSGSADAPSATGAEPTAVAGPEAIKVARRFAGAFVLYETGKGERSKIRTTFAETAIPKLTKSLMKRPPRLPADVQVPKAKVLNIVPGPHSGDTYTFSISLLRVGVTSELRVDMQRDEKSGEWQVTDVLG